MRLEPLCGEWNEEIRIYCNSQDVRVVEACRRGEKDWYKNIYLEKSYTENRISVAYDRSTIGIKWARLNKLLICSLLGIPFVRRTRRVLQTFREREL